MNLLQERRPVARLVRSALIAALYIVIVAITQPISFGALQFRAAEALTVLPILFPEAVLGLYVGVLLANVLGGLGLWDILGGSAVTLLAAWLTYRTRTSWLAYLWPIVLNGLLVSLYLHAILELPYWSVALSITLSQALVILGLGVPLVAALRRVTGKAS